MCGRENKGNTWHVMDFNRLSAPVPNPVTTHAVTRNHRHLLRGQLDGIVEIGLPPSWWRLFVLPPVAKP